MKDFGKGSHTSSTEPYFYEAAYLHQRDSPIPMNERGQYVVAKEVPMGKDVGKDTTPKKGNCAQTADYIHCSLF